MDVIRIMSIRRKLATWYKLMHGVTPSSQWLDGAVTARQQQFGVNNYDAIVHALDLKIKDAQQFDAEMKLLAREWTKEYFFAGKAPRDEGVGAPRDEDVKVTLDNIKKYNKGNPQAIKDDLAQKILVEQLLNFYRASGLNDANKQKEDSERENLRETYIADARDHFNLQDEEEPLSASQLIEYMQNKLDKMNEAAKDARAKAAAEREAQERANDSLGDLFDTYPSANTAPPADTAPRADIAPPAGTAPPAGPAQPAGPPADRLARGGANRTATASTELTAIVDETSRLLLQARKGQPTKGSKLTIADETRARQEVNDLLKKHVPQNTEHVTMQRLPYAKLYKSVLQFFQLKHQLGQAIESAKGDDPTPAYEKRVSELLQNNNKNVDFALEEIQNKIEEYMSETTKRAECKRLVMLLMQAEAHNVAGDASSNSAIDGGEDELAISEEQLVARMDIETKMANRESKGCIAWVRDKLMKLQTDGNAAQRQVIAGKMTRAQSPGRARASTNDPKMLLAFDHVYRRLILERKPHGPADVEEALQDMKRVLQAEGQQNNSTLLEEKARLWLERTQARLKRERKAGKDDDRLIENTTTPKLREAVDKELRLLASSKIKEGPTKADVTSRAYEHLARTGNDVQKATARANFAAKYLEVLMLKNNNQKLSKAAKNDLEAQLSTVEIKKVKWSDALRKLQEDIQNAQEAAQDVAQSAPETTFPDTLGYRYDPSSSEEEDEDTFAGGDGGARRMALNPNPDDDDDDDDDDDEEDLPEDIGTDDDLVRNPFADLGDGDLDQDLCPSDEEVNAKQQCNQRKQYCADKSPKLNGYTPANPHADAKKTRADAKKTRAVAAHMEPFMLKHTDRLPNNAWYEKDGNPLKAPQHKNGNESLPSDEQSDGYTVNFLGGGNYTRDDADAWKAFYADELYLTQQIPGAYFDLKGSNNWSQEKLDALFETTKMAHELTHNVERIFAWRLVVVHLRALRVIGCTERLPVTACFEMDALVDNVAHMLKYRRCVRMAKCLYTNVGMRSLHEQYRAGLLNVQHAHHHQDESATDLGIARRIIRQAHVANYVHYYWYKQEAPTYKVYADIESPEQQLLLAERFCTNPPMAPIMCSAPPRSGKSALAMLMISFAVKLGANVEYGVSPNKKIPIADVEKKFNDLGWCKTQSLPLPSTPALNADIAGQEEKEIREIQMRLPNKKICIYSEDEARDVVQMNRRIHAVGNDVDAWTFHVRDEAQTLSKGRQKQQEMLLNALRDSYPSFYGLSMCVSATLLPVYQESEITGSTNSIYQLLNKRWRVGDQASVVTRRGALEKNIVLQHWSFPIAPDYLTPPRSAYPLSSVPQPPTPHSDQSWYMNYYEKPPPNGTIERSTHYYGTHFHIQKRAGPGLSLQGKIMLDPDWYEQTRTCDRFVRTALKNGRLSKTYRLEHAYFEYLKAFNRVNKRYFEMGLSGRWREGPTTRIANPPIKRLTYDTSLILEQAREWLATDMAPAVGAPDAECWPMYILAPVREQDLKNGRQEWAVMLCKLAWLRFHTDWLQKKNEMQQQYGQDGSKGKQGLRKDYGINVLVYASKRKDDAYVGLVCQAADFREPEHGQQGLVSSIVFDPTLRENRLPEHTFDWDADGGVMLQSILVPELATGANERSDFDAYATEVTANPKNAPSAANWLRKNVVLTSHTFNPSVNYFVEEREAALAQQASNQEASDQEAKELGEEQAAEGAVGPYLAAQDSESDDGAEEGHVANAKIPNLNAIALRLCVSQHADAQDAISNVLIGCDICKVAAVGHAMFSAGLTLQTTLTRDSKVHMFVPRHMSLWASTRNNGPDLSALYQLVGRGFADLKLRKLPDNWKLDLLCQEGLLKYIEAYGDAELLASMVHNESLEGRRMTLGATLWTANKNDLRKRYGTRRLKNDEKNNTLMHMLFRKSLPSEKLQYQRVFGNVRNCLVGEYAPQKRSWLTQRERRLEFWDRAFVGEATDYGNAPVELQRHDLGDKVDALKTGKDEIGLADNPCFAPTAAPSPTKDNRDIEEVNDEDDDDYDVPREWPFSPQGSKSEQRSKRLENAEKRARENYRLVMERVLRELQRQKIPPEQVKERKRTLVAEYADMVEGADLRMRIRYREYESVHVWVPEKLANEIVSDQGRYEGLFDWYLSELRVQEDKQRIVNGRSGHIVPDFGVERPPARDAARDLAAVQRYMLAVKQSHVSVLMRTDYWVQTFCKYVKQYLLDLKHGPETACDPQWIYYRERFLGKAHGYSKEKETRWHALRLRRFNDTVINAQDVARAKELLNNDELFKSVAMKCRTDGTTTWDTFADAIENAFGPDRAIKALIQARVEAAPVQTVAPEDEGSDDATEDDDADRGEEGNSGFGEDVNDGGSSASEEGAGAAGPSLDDGNNNTKDDDDEPREVNASVLPKRNAPTWSSKLSTEAGDRRYKSVQVLEGENQRGERVLKGERKLARWVRPMEENNEVAMLMDYFAKGVANMLLDPERNLPRMQQPEGVPSPEEFPPQLLEKHRDAQFDQRVSWKAIWSLIRVDPSTGVMQQYITDEIVGIYINMMNARNKQMLAIEGYSGKLLNTYFFPSMFFSNIWDNKRTPQYDFSKQQPKNENSLLAKQRGDVFERDLAFVVVNISNQHWTLIVVNFIKRRIEYFDGFDRGGKLFGNPSVYINVVRRWLMDEKIRLSKGEETWDTTEWSYHVWTRAQGKPGQDDGYNCGIIALQVANYYAQQGHLVFDAWRQFRLRMLSEIINGKLYDGDNWLELDTAAEAAAEAQAAAEAEAAAVEAEAVAEAAEAVAEASAAIELAEQYYLYVEKRAKGTSWAQVLDAARKDRAENRYNKDVIKQLDQLNAEARVTYADILDRHFPPLSNKRTRTKAASKDLIYAKKQLATRKQEVRGDK